MQQQHLEHCSVAEQKTENWLVQCSEAQPCSKESWECCLMHYIRELQCIEESLENVLQQCWEENLGCLSRAQQCWAENLELCSETPCSGTQQC